MERFDGVYDSLSSVYSELESIMGSIYDELQKNPTNDNYANLLQGLGNVPLKVVSSQKEFVAGYGDKDMKDMLLSNLDAKEMVMTNALAKDKNRKDYMQNVL